MKTTQQGSPLLRRCGVGEVAAMEGAPIDASTLGRAREIVDAVKREGRSAVIRFARELDGAPEGPLVIERRQLLAAAQDLDPATRSLLERTADRIGRFAAAQRAAIGACELDVPGGRAGHTVEPVSRAGCYAPGGRYPLVSSVLMTAVTARRAGVEEVIVATPRPGPLMLAAAGLAGADCVLAAGGAHAIAALAFGAAVPRCDVIVGPGNRYVTAAKYLVSAVARIDMLAGPSELMVVADASADPERIAADLLAQAEHDPDARPSLVSFDGPLLETVDAALSRRLETLPTAAVARSALDHGFAVLVTTRQEALAVVDRVAPEHLQLMTGDARALAARVRHAGAVFIGSASAEVLGDYGAGPNHTLPTGGTARSRGGLSVMDFLRLRSFLDLDCGSALADDAAALAALEGLTGHERAARLRSSPSL